MFHFSASMKQDECYFIYLKHFKINFAFWNNYITGILYMYHDKYWIVNQLINQS